MRKANQLFEEGRYGEARALYEQLVPEATELYGPDGEETLATLSIRATNDLWILQELSPETAHREPDEAPGLRHDINRCLERTERAASYRSLFVSRDASRDEFREEDFICELEFVKPDRYHVFQTGWFDTEAVYDEWITIGADHYRNGGIQWLQGDPSGEPDTNRNLLVEKPLALLRDCTPASAQLYSYRGAPEWVAAPRDLSRRYLLVEFTSVPTDVLARFLNGRSGFSYHDSRARIWIESDTGLLAKAELHFEVENPERERAPWKIEQAFTSYDEEISIGAPEAERLEPNSGALLFDDHELAQLRSIHRDLRGLSGEPRDTS